MGSYSSLTVSLLPDSTDSDLPSKESQQQRQPSFQKDVNGHQLQGEDDDSLTMDVWDEAKKAFELAWPLSLFNLSGFSILVITVMFIGHLGEQELSSASLASSFSSVTCFIVTLGIASALETLCGQAYGAKKYHMLGVYMQAAWIVGCGYGVFVLIVWFNMESVLKAMGQDPEVSRMAAQYLKYLAPGVFGSAFLQPITKFLQSQSVVMPLVVCAGSCVLFHIVCCQLVIFTFGFGFIGGAIAITISYCLLLATLVAYTWSSGKFKKTWTGFTWDAFGAVKQYLKICIPSTLMLCLEYWTVEFLVLAAGLLPNPQLQLSLLSISLSTTNLAFNIPIGLSAAVSTRVSNELGANRPHAAKLAGKVVFGISIISACVIATAMVIGRHVWGRAFSSEEEVVASVAQIMPLIALSALLDGIQGVLSGIARGSGRQDIGAIINLTAFYIVGVPTGLYLGFAMRMNAWGLWIGLLCGQLTQTVLLLLLIATMNWKKMAEEALKRVNPDPILPSTGMVESG